MQAHVLPQANRPHAEGGSHIIEGEKNDWACNFTRRDNYLSDPKGRGIGGGSGIFAFAGFHFQKCTSTFGILYRKRPSRGFWVGLNSSAECAPFRGCIVLFFFRTEGPFQRDSSTFAWNLFGESAKMCLDSARRVGTKRCLDSVRRVGTPQAWTPFGESAL